MTYHFTSDLLLDAAGPQQARRRYNVATSRQLAVRRAAQQMATLCTRICMRGSVLQWQASTQHCCPWTKDGYGSELSVDALRISRDQNCLGTGPEKQRCQA